MSRGVWSPERKPGLWSTRKPPAFEWLGSFHFSFPERQLVYQMDDGPFLETQRLLKRSLSTCWPGLWRGVWGRGEGAPIQLSRCVSFGSGCVFFGCLRRACSAFPPSLCWKSQSHCTHLQGMIVGNMVLASFLVIPQKLP